MRFANPNMPMPKGGVRNPRAVQTANAGTGPRTLPPNMPMPNPVRGGGMAPTSVATTMKKGGKVKSASARADGCAIRGKTRA